ncbi:hypothetical protein Tco_1200506 [Tanacetum coccineum]
MLYSSIAALQVDKMGIANKHLYGLDCTLVGSTISLEDERTTRVIIEERYPTACRSAPCARVPGEKEALRPTEQQKLPILLATTIYLSNSRARQKGKLNTNQGHQLTIYHT